MKVKNIIIAGLILIANSFIQAQNSYRKESEIRVEPKDILEFYLIIPGEPTAIAKTTEDNMSEFEYRKKYLRPLPNKEIVIDKKNGFMSVVDNSVELTYKMQLTYFVQADGTKIVAFYTDQAGGDCDSYSLTFYKYQNKAFIDVTNQVLPRLTFKDFFPTAKNSVMNLYEPQFELPQVGTTIKAKATYICNFDIPITNGKSLFEEEKYYNYLKSLQKTDVSLLWNKATGKFTVKK